MWLKYPVVWPSKLNDQMLPSWVGISSKSLNGYRVIEHYQINFKLLNEYRIIKKIWFVKYRIVE